MIVYDIEIKRAIAGKGESRMVGIEYCDGWHDHANMGISVICAYDYTENRYRAFCHDNLSDFQELANQRDVVVSYNGISFDNRVCAVNGIVVSDEKSFDLLVEIWKAAGLAPTFQYPSHVGYTLDAVIKATFPGSTGKTGHGALAPVDWQRGRIGNVIDYCLADVWLEKRLMDLVINDKPIKDPITKKDLILPKPS